MCTLTKSVRWLEGFFRAYPEWYIALHDTRYRALDDVSYNPELWVDIFSFRFDYLPVSYESFSWGTLLESEKMSTALRVIARRLKKL